MVDDLFDVSLDSVFRVSVVILLLQHSEWLRLQAYTTMARSLSFVNMISVLPSCHQRVIIQKLMGEDAESYSQTLDGVRRTLQKSYTRGVQMETGKKL
ncbi:uncharacterized protein LOC128096701 isoform X4 [Peromyscus californicus insignis]|uniref:uncharacterized protein LOC128096701 isoform X4 n=1 Tax=Peromyscus californicus insignis TaxID=564181 RepID=UPI0022A7E8D3|nr:uncharacterized protein LOC128096701 isoform X4 [Peromyscus californicus insignis]